MEPPPPPAPPASGNLFVKQLEIFEAQKQMLDKVREMVAAFHADLDKDREDRAREAKADKDKDDDHERQEYNWCLRVFGAEALSGLVGHSPSHAAEKAFEHAKAMYAQYMKLKRIKPSSE